MYNISRRLERVGAVVAGLEITLELFTDPLRHLHLRLGHRLIQSVAKTGAVGTTVAFDHDPLQPQQTGAIAPARIELCLQFLSTGRASSASRRR